MEGDGLQGGHGGCLPSHVSLQRWQSLLSNVHTQRILLKVIDPGRHGRCADLWLLDAVCLWVEDRIVMLTSYQ